MSLRMSLDELLDADTAVGAFLHPRSSLPGLVPHLSGAPVVEQPVS